MSSRYSVPDNASDLALAIEWLNASDVEWSVGPGVPAPGEACVLIEGHGIVAFDRWGEARGKHQHRRSDLGMPYYVGPGRVV